jgi:aquaporin Z
MPISHRLAAEFVGTLWLVLGGCGAAVISAGFPNLGIGFVGVSFAFGLSVLTGAYALGHISGGHFNPAVTLGLWAGGRFPVSEIVPYWIAQILGAVCGAAIIFAIASGVAGFQPGGFASNGFAAHSPGGYNLVACAISELVLTFIFVVVILGTTSTKAPAGFAPLAIGLSLTLIHLISIPVTNTSVNPARSTGPAIFADGWALEQLWLFWIAPLVGAVVAGLFHRWLSSEVAETYVVTETKARTRTHLR